MFMRQPNWATKFFIMHKRLVKIVSKNIHSFDSSY